MWQHKNARTIQQSSIAFGSQTESQASSKCLLPVKTVRHRHSRPIVILHLPHFLPFPHFPFRTSVMLPHHMAVNFCTRFLSTPLALISLFLLIPDPAQMSHIPRQSSQPFGQESEKSVFVVSSPISNLSPAATHRFVKNCPPAFLVPKTPPLRQFSFSTST